VLEVTNIRRRFGPIQAVDDISFRVGEGEIFGFLGPNGAGKTTTLSILTGILRPDEGSVVVNGHDLSQDPIRAKASLGLCPQEIALYEDLAGRANLTFFGELYGLRGASLRARCNELLDFVGLTERAGDPVSQYSGGMKRRLNLAAAMVHDPKVVLLDEPTAGVDPQSRNAVFEAIRTMADQGRAVVYTTHYMEEAERLCDRIAIIDRGKVCAEGTFPELLALVESKDMIRIQVQEGPGLDDVALVLDRQGFEAKADGSLLTVRATESGPALTAASAALGQAGLAMVSADVARPTLETVFLHLTGRRLRD
jgi:ABC-2 type transport system ATP-binding protein